MSHGGIAQLTPGSELMGEEVKIGRENYLLKPGDGDLIVPVALSLDPQ